ncbi:hypothetical protein H3J60_004552 [Salmonella enterica]|nr:hypothetical protein [Salmonella enterica]
MFKKFKNMSNREATFLVIYIFTVLMGLAVVFALTGKDPVEKLFQIAPIIGLSFLAMIVGVVMAWIPEWFRK